LCPVCGATSDQFEPLEDATGAAASGGDVGMVVVVGAGIAGLAAVETIRSTAPTTEILLISKEKELPYYRLNLTRYLAGEIDEDALPIHEESWYEEKRIRLVRGVEVRALSLEDRTVELSSGTREPFDRLVLTVGAHPFVPPFPGAGNEGVGCLRTLGDARKILEFAQAGGKCVCIGGGILGLETAGALARRGAEVALVESYGWLLPRQLNRKAGEVLQRHVESLGIELIQGVRTEEITGEGRARAVAFHDGSSTAAERVVITTGVRPNSYLARRAGLHVDRGIVVDDHLMTSHPSVLAAGDVAQHRGALYGFWMASQSQGKIAGMNAAGLEAEFSGIPRSNTLKVLGLDLVSIGRIEPEDASYDVVEEESDDHYFRFLFRDGGLVGAILLGDTALSARVTSAIETGRSFSGLLRRRPSVRDVAASLKDEVGEP
jgi:nitrite reductase (NADH) large subunit